ncbi:DUF1446 domain-containing protein [Pseudomaricurvus alkylphenolicus]|uniref:acyclic terpene utilization AtuA family protein n=1 Tax=Pseudomaricurvus alkylphenolicus TaxID=1306991 RepID=UPI001423D5EA|nr:acyclic terpene utilization AtuA family protein [Pseudomaricurvus alkylphenolicus]NIB38156.1 DUF1446 domain-containing protein [Pseudomaricurvus alkylphenolicus]
MNPNTVRIGGASGFWGDSAHATAQFLGDDHPDYIVYDYLAEITMSIMARARAKDSSMGYAVSFMTEAMLPNLHRIAELGIKVIANAGGVNPEACAKALQSGLDEKGLNLKVAWVEGDDLIAQRESFAGDKITEMFSGDVFPATDKIQSINAYLGAFPIAEALNRGADIVITGRCVDSAVTLGACIHHFNWHREDLDQLALGSLAGHILECGPQATGGNFTDWEDVPDRDTIGYPIAEINADGSFVTTKPRNTGGLVNIGTVAEQLVYEVGDPGAYLLPDVVCDFTDVKLEQLGPDRVLVSGAKGRAAPDSYKVSATYADQFRGGSYWTFYGVDADKKAAAFAESIFKASRNTFAKQRLPDFSETSIELIGAESQYGQYQEHSHCRELILKFAAKHPQKRGIDIMLKESTGLGLATPPGLSSFGGNRAKASPEVRLFSFLVPKTGIDIKVHIDGCSVACPDPDGQAFEAKPPESGNLGKATSEAGVPAKLIAVPLIELAWGRSGDKGNKANIGIIARKPEYLPYINEALSTDVVASRFQHFFDDGKEVNVEKFQLPGLNAINFLLHDVLAGGGIASLRNDPQAKGYAQLLLACPVLIPSSLV